MTYGRWIRPHVQLGERRYSSFQICGGAGLVLALVQSELLIRYLNLSQAVLLGMTVVAVFTFLGLVMATKVLTGEERITYYHHEIAVMTVLALFLSVTRQPLLPYLDIAILGIGLFLACGRVGCLMAGCCHGRIFSRGVRYGSDHAEAGFPSYLVGVPLFPTQAVESVFVLLVVVSGLALVVRGYPPGTALASYVLAYGAGRFWLEFARGDTARPYLLGFSQPQWISLLLAVAVTFCEWTRLLPAVRWHGNAAALLAVSMLAIKIWRLRDPTAFEVTEARHVREISAALQQVKYAPPPPDLPSDVAVIHVAETSRGYRFSEWQTLAGPQLVRHYSISKIGQLLSLKEGRLLSRLIATLERRTDSFHLIRGDYAAVHIVFDSPFDASTTAPGPHTHATRATD